MKVTNKATRPAGTKDRCFYCEQPVGGHHNPDCVLVTREYAVLKFEVELVVQVRRDQTPEQMADMYTPGSGTTWCADNITQLVAEQGLMHNPAAKNTKSTCLCERVQAKFLRMATQGDLERAGLKPFNGDGDA